MNKACTLTVHDGIPDWCEEHKRYHHGHHQKYALGTDQKSIDYRRRWSKSSEPPTFLQKLGHYASSTVRHVMSGFQTAPLEIQAQRQALCAACPHNTNNTCTKCGCPTKPTLIGDKLARASESCPLNPPKWKAWKPDALHFWTKVIRDNIVDDGWPENWHALPEVQHAFRQVLKEKIAAPLEYPAGKYQGRGIVILGGGERYGIGTYVSACMARHHGWTGPIQIWHRGQDEPLKKEVFDEINVELVNAYQFLAANPCRRWGMDKWGDPNNRWLSWGMKSYAILNSPFQEVLYLDADAYVVAPPERLFDDNPAGTLIWYDLPGCHSNLKWEVFGIPHDGTMSIQGGQWLIDKNKCWAGLTMYRWLDDWSDYTYRYGYGDQDNFRLAWAATKTTHYSYPFKGEPVYTQPMYGCLQAWDRAGQAIINHRISDKQFQHNFLEGRTPPENGLRVRQRWIGEEAAHEFARQYRSKTQ